MAPGPLPFEQVDLILADLAALLVLPLALLPDSSVAGLARSALGLLFVLFLPGYVTIAIAYPGERQLDVVERFTFSFGVSVAISLLVGLGLTYTTWGLRLAPVLVSMAALVVVGSAVAFLRRRLTSGKSQTVSSEVHASLALVPGSVRSRSWPRLALAVAFGTVLVAVIAAQPSLRAPVILPGQPLTEFYLIGADGKLGDAQPEAVYGQQSTMGLGLRNLAGENASFRVVATIDGKPVGQTGEIRLTTGERWEGQLTYQPPSSAPRQLVTLQLYEGTSADPRQRLQLWIDVAASR